MFEKIRFDLTDGGGGPEDWYWDWDDTDGFPIWEDAWESEGKLPAYWVPGFWYWENQGGPAYRNDQGAYINPQDQSQILFSLPGVWMFTFYTVLWVEFDLPEGNHMGTAVSHIEFPGARPLDSIRPVQMATSWGSNYFGFTHDVSIVVAESDLNVTPLSVYIQFEPEPGAMSFTDQNTESYWNSYNWQGFWDWTWTHAEMFRIAGGGSSGVTDYELPDYECTEVERRLGASVLTDPSFDVQIGYPVGPNGTRIPYVASNGQVMWLNGDPVEPFPKGWIHPPSAGGTPNVYITNSSERPGYQGRTGSEFLFYDGVTTSGASPWVQPLNGYLCDSPIVNGTWPMTGMVEEGDKVSFGFWYYSEYDGDAPRVGWRRAEYRAVDGLPGAYTDIVFIDLPAKTWTYLEVFTDWELLSYNTLYAIQMRFYRSMSSDPAVVVFDDFIVGQTT